MGQYIFSLFKSTRPRQWLKNFAVFTTILFTGQLFNGDLLWRSIVAFIVFCFLSSSSYIINDVLDAPKDRKHPFKRFRPIASGTVSVGQAILMSLALAAAGLWMSVRLGNLFFVFSVIFLALQYGYSFILKRFTVIDILTITMAYILRVYAGEAATGYQSRYGLRSPPFLALFLAIGKRLLSSPLSKAMRGRTKDTRVSSLFGETA